MLRESQNKTEAFKEKLYSSNIHYKNGEFEIVGEYVRNNIPIEVKTKYGICLMHPQNLLRNAKPRLLSAKDKNSYFMNMVLEAKGYLPDFIDNYENNDKKIRINTEYGICAVNPSELLKNYEIGIDSALDKTEYLINQFKSVHKNTYDYSLVEYSNNSKKVKIICEKHGVFEQAPFDHKRGHGCSMCAEEGKGFYSFKKWSSIRPENESIFYIIKCTKDDEEFYKFGITALSVKNRYDSKRAMPYNYEVFFEVKNHDRKMIWDIEKDFKNMPKNYKYTPSINFPGSTECFIMDNSVMDILNKYI